MLARRRPQIVVDCVNTATAFAYQNIFRSAAELRGSATDGHVDAELVERHLATLYLPQLIRHVQVALDAMHRNDTNFYLKVGTAGTGGGGARAADGGTDAPATGDDGGGCGCRVVTERRAASSVFALVLLAFGLRRSRRRAPRRQR